MMDDKPHGSKMSNEELERCKEFLKVFSVSTDLDYIPLTSGGNSCIVNPDTEWKEFLGASINAVAIAVAEKLGKPTRWVD